MTVARRPDVLSIVRGSDAGAARAADPALDANTYAVADDVDLTLVLKDRGVELGLRDIPCDQGSFDGVPIPVAEPGGDLRALLASGIRVHAVVEDLQIRGIDAEDLVPGIEPLTEAELTRLILASDVVLTTSS